MNSIKMGDICYNCPLCCSETFSSKQTLLEHLSNVEQNYYCPVCKNKWSTLADLIDHLSLDNCQPDNTVHTIVFDTGAQAENDENSVGNSNCSTTQFAHISEEGVVNQFTSDTLTSAANGDEMYVEYLSKDMSTKALHNQELKLIRDPNPDHDSYIIVTQGSTDLESGHTIVTKQNQDGTISLTAVKDMKTENDPLLSSTENDLSTQEESREELYSCNTCGVSFSSVLEHIQNYHNDQEVVVEEPIDDTLSIEQESLDNDMAVLVRDKQTSRRVITDTGDIVETPVKPITTLRQDSIELRSSELKDNEGRVYGRRYVQIEKLCDSVIKNIKQDEPGGGPYHKVAQITSGGTKMYQCTICNVCVNTLVEFKSHPCKTLKYKCPHCPVAYHNSKSLCAHMKVHKIKVATSKALVTYECEVCCTVFPTNKSLKLHKRMHDPIKSRPIEPPVANTDGSEVTSDRYLCSICDKLIPLDYRTIHQNSHKTSDKMNCSICNKKFQSVEYLEMHMNVHSSDKVKMSAQDKSLPYNCVFCPRRFARPHEKVKHERIHTGEKPHSCEICGKSFRVSYCLTLHMRTHTGARPYACPHCGKRFKAHSVFNHHLLTHSEVRAYKCPYCPKAFKTSVQLAGHKNSHTKPFSCPHCNRPFASLYAVRVHTETHARQNNLKFKCSLCGASYARAFALKDHVKQQHNKDLDANEHMLGLKEEDWMQINAVSNMKGDLPQEINDLELHTTELIVP